MIRFSFTALAAFTALFAFGAAPSIRPPKISASFESPALSSNATVKAMVVSPKDMAEIRSLERQYVNVAKANYPLIVRTLHMENDPVRKPVHILVTFDYGGVAETEGGGDGDKEGPTIKVSAKYALARPKDLGMIVHEMVHVVQRYPNYDPGWLVEGIADYVRWFKYEPESARPHPDPAKATARDSYRTTGAFLNWASEKYDPNLVPKLNAALRANAYSENLFKDYTGKTLDELNTEWLASLHPAQP